MNYWVIINNEQRGPLQLDELRGLGINAHTPVWRPGLADWCRAGNLDELAPLLVTVPQPPVPSGRITYGAHVPGAPLHPGAPRMSTPMPESYLPWSIVATLLCCLPAGVVAIVFATQVSSRYERGDIEGSQRASDNAQLWIIISAVLGLIMAPFTMLLGAL